MYCKNCGSAMEQGAAVCINCGVPSGQGANYCANCGNPLQPGAAVCMSCGFASNAAVKAPAVPGAKSKMAAGLLGIFLGGFGVHQFYLGNTKRAIIEIVVTVCTCGIGAWWGIIEGIMILMGKINTDANGNPLAD